MVGTAGTGEPLIGRVWLPSAPIHRTPIVARTFRLLTSSALPTIAPSRSSPPEGRTGQPRRRGGIAARSWRCILLAEADSRLPSTPIAVGSCPGPVSMTAETTLKAAMRASMRFRYGLR